MTLEQQIQRASDIGVRLESLLIGKAHKAKTLRDPTCLRYWSLIFDLHQGVVVLLRAKHYAPAFARMRAIAECWCRLWLVTHGSEAQFDSIVRGTYATEITVVMGEIDAALWKEPMLGSWLTKERLRTLHGCTHRGIEQLTRQSDGNDIVSNYPEAEVPGFLNCSTYFAYMTALLATDFLGYAPENQSAREIVGGFLPTAATVQT
jgi:hypothetical protein